MTNEKIIQTIDELRSEYTKWKEEHPDINNEVEINKFLLFRSMADNFEWKDTPLDHEAKKLLEAAKVDVIRKPHQVSTFNDEYAPVLQSGEIQSDIPITIDEIKDFYKKFIVASPVAWIVGGVVTNKDKGSKNDVDFLISLPDSEQIKRIISFRLFRMFPPNIRDRIQFLFENKNYHGCFTDNFPLYRLVMEPIIDAKIEKMAEIRLRTKGTDLQAKQATEASIENKITWGEFFLPQKPMRGYKSDQLQSITNFLDLFKDDQYPIFSSYKADGINTEWHISDDEVVVYTEDGTDETSSFPETIKEAKKIAPGKKIVLLAEVEFWNNSQHFPREVAAGKIHKIKPDESGIIANVYDIVYLGEDIHNKTQGDRIEIAKSLNFPQSTETPSSKFKWNLIPHKKSDSRNELEKETIRLASLKHSEGNVAKQASSVYDLAGKRANSWIKYHKSILFTAVCIDVVETKTPGVYNLKWALVPGKDKVYKKEDILYDDSRDTALIYGGKTFSTKDKPKKYDPIKIECETFNITYDQKTKIYSISAWAPRQISTLERDSKIDNVDEVEKRAIENNTFQAKIITSDNKISYLPGKSGEEVSSKSETFTEEENIISGMVDSMPLNIKFLGTKGLIEEESLSHKYHTCIILNDGKNSIMVDCGSNNKEISKIQDQSVENVLLSHPHQDHISDLLKSLGKTVYMSKESDGRIREEIIPKGLRKIFLNKKSFQIGNFKITPYNVLHSVLFPMTVFFVQWNDMNILISTDIVGFHSGDRDKIFEKLDVWVTDGSSVNKDLIRYYKDKKEPYGHTALNNSLKWANDINPLILITHIGKEGIELGDENLSEHLKSRFPEKNIQVAKDNMVIRLGKK